MIVRYDNHGPVTPALEFEALRQHVRIGRLAFCIHFNHIPCDSHHLGKCILTRFIGTVHPLVGV